MTKFSNPVILCIIDGLGVSAKVKGNAYLAAKTPTLDRLWDECPNVVLEASGAAVGLPPGQVGNSEVGHFTIGTGQIIKQGLARIHDSDLKNNLFITKIIEQKPARVHVIGMVSEGGVHGHIEHSRQILAALQEGGVKTYFHAITDGRDDDLQNAGHYLSQLLKFNIATISGRFYAMDRDNRMDRTKAAYDAIVLGQGEKFTDPAVYLEAQYRQVHTDEFIKPAAREDYHGIETGDIVIFTNFRADRARQLTAAIIDPGFTGFDRALLIPCSFYGMMSYSKELDCFMEVLFEKKVITNTLGEFIAQQGGRQLRIAETEKYAHVTFFFNGGREAPFEGEDRILIPSPKVTTYDLVPEMSSGILTDKLVSAIENQHYDFICVNYANADMVGHSGNFAAAVLAMESIDRCLSRVVEAAKKASATLLITADHGNIEEMLTEEGEVKTSHSLNPVPFIYVGKDKVDLKELKGLADIAGFIKTVID